MDVLQPARGGSPEPVRLSDLDLLQGAAGLEGLGAFRVFEGTLVDPERAAVRLAVAALTPDVNPAIPLWGLRTLADGHDYMIRIPRAMGAMALGGGVAGLRVAAIGLYGLLAFRVRQRRRELGIHLALGADGRALAMQTMGFAMRQVLPALVLGLLVAWLIAPILGVFLLGLDPRGLGTYAGVAVSFLVVTVLAAALPAFRASRVDPAQVLRGD